jgi:hypothetical protein
MWNELKMQWKQGGILVRLILINVGVFVVVTTLQLLVALGGGQPFPLDQALGLATTWKPQLLMERPWTILTHMFVHMRVWHGDEPGFALLDGPFVHDPIWIPSAFKHIHCRGFGWVCLVFRGICGDQLTFINFSFKSSRRCHSNLNLL